MPEKTFIAREGASLDLSDGEIDEIFSRTLTQIIEELKVRGPVLLLPPDITRFHSRAGFLTDLCYRTLSGAGIPVSVLPALGTHMPLSAAELDRMFPNTPKNLFRVHDWRSDVVELGRIEKEWVEKTSLGAVSYDWPAQVNKILRDGGFSLIISLGQIVPHEVVGMANHAKNIFVGTGGKEAIDKSHFVGAAYGLERMLGRTDTPVRALFDEGMRRFGEKLPPVLYALTVLGARSEDEARAAGKQRGSLAMRGLYAGFGRDCFERACDLSRKINVDILDEPVKKAVVYLDPEEFRTTWLGNKAVYRTRMAMADNGELLIIAPGLERFGEDKGIDALIRRHGYRPSGVVREKAAADPELAGSLSAAAHLIHGSSEGRFTIRYCPGPGVSRAEIESVGYEWGDIKEAMERYNINSLSLGWNTLAGGEKIFFVPNPALGLWAEKQRFNSAG
jgi:nickel-dependent lactate racemase